MRNINTLHPFVLAKANELKLRAKELLGLRVIITECLRTADEQAALYAQGRNELAVTNAMRAKAGMAPISAHQNTFTITNAATVADSFHGYGLAFDIAITDAQGKTIEWSSKSDWNEDGINDWLSVGQLGIDLGLEWGGNWTSRPDMPHYQYTFGKTIRALKEDPSVMCGKTICIGA